MGPRELALGVCDRLRSAGYQAYLVGGCVRDLLLGRDPADFDVSTDAIPGRVLEIFPGSLMVGAQFGVVVVVEGDAQVEVATFRQDVGYSDGRHPDQVVFAPTAEQDVRRRDFTINALLMDPRTEEILDFVGGREDLRGGIVRAIGDPAPRFEEDRLRMVRAVRFASRFGYTIEPATLRAIQELAATVTLVSAERLGDELTRLLTQGAARRAFELLDETGLLGPLLREIARMKGVAQPPEFHPEGDVWIHTRMLLEGLGAGCSAALGWGALLHDVGKPPTFTPASGPGTRIRFDGHAEIGTRMAEEICRRFRFSTDRIAQIAALVANHMRFKDVMQMRASTLKRFVRLDRFEEHMELHRLDCLACHGSLENYQFVRKFLAETPPDVVRPPRLVTGDDLKAMGLKPGPQFREILGAVEDGQLEGTLNSHDDAVRYIHENYGHYIV
jgi:poly(A) polymerase